MKLNGEISCSVRFCMNQISPDTMIDCYNFRCSHCKDEEEIYMVYEYNSRNLLTEKRKICINCGVTDWLMAGDIGYYCNRDTNTWHRIPIAPGYLKQYCNQCSFRHPIRIHDCSPICPVCDNVMSYHKKVNGKFRHSFIHYLRYPEIFDNPQIE